jgi:hypothetical protein
MGREENTAAALNSEDKLHIYLFCFMESNTNGFKFSSATRGHNTPCVTGRDLQEAKEYAGAREEAVTMSVSYMGHMTQSQFLKDTRGREIA